MRKVSVEIRRSLHDLMHQLPVVEAAIKLARFLKMSIYVKFLGHRKNNILFLDLGIVAIFIFHLSVSGGCSESRIIQSRI
jgi:hypothetical protein